MGRSLIVNADDFGLDAHTVEWTIRGFEAGAISSATIMAGMPATEQAIAYAKAHPQFSFGIHFYLVDEKPLSPPEAIPSMVDPKTGKLWTTRQFIIRNFLRLVKVEDIFREMMAQYQAIASTGLAISHVDGHGHNHRLPQSIKALERLQQELQATGRLKGRLAVRRCQDLPKESLGLLSRLINPAMQRRLDRAGFAMTDHFVMMCGKTTDPNWFIRAVETLPEGLTEIGIHPGQTEPWREIDSKVCLEKGTQLYSQGGIRLMPVVGR